MSGSLLSNVDGRVLRLVLNRPEKRNALDPSLCRELVSALERADADAGVGAVLLCGSGKAFCAGMDLDEALEAETAGQAELHQRLFTAVFRIGKPIVAAVHGAALAGGAGLAANAHIVVAAPDAVFGLTEIRIGLWPFVVFRAVAHAVGERRALELSLTGRTFSAEEAERWGLVHYLSEDCETAAAEIAGSLAAHTPETVRAGLRFVRESRALAPAEAALLAARCRAELFRSPAVQDGIRTFRDKRSRR